MLGVSSSLLKLDLCVYVFEYNGYKTKGYEGTVMSIVAPIFWLIMPIPMSMYSRPCVHAHSTF